MTKTTITNTTKGYRGFHSVDGEVMLAPGETREGVDISADELASAKSTGYFAFGAKGAEEAAGSGDTLPTNIAQLKKIARDEGIDLGDAKSVADVSAAITAARAAKAGGVPTPPTPPADDLDNMADDDLRNTVAALTGKPASDYADTERDELLKLARGEG